MQTLSTFIGKYKVIFIALGIVCSVAFLGRLAMADSITPQQKAAADILVQQKIKDTNQGAFDAYAKADGQIKADQACVTDAAQCSLTQGTTPAR